MALNRPRFVLPETRYSSLQQAEFILNLVVGLSPLRNLSSIQTHLCEGRGRVSLICKWSCRIMFHNQHSLHQLPFAFPDVAKKMGYVSYVRLSYLTISKLHAIEYSVEFIQKKKNETMECFYLSGAYIKSIMGETKTMQVRFKVG